MVNRTCCSLSSLHGISFVRACEKNFRNSCLQCAGGPEGRLAPKGTEKSAPCSAQRRPAPPSALCRADPTCPLCVRVLDSTGLNRERNQIKGYPFITGLSPFHGRDEKRFLFLAADQLNDASLFLYTLFVKGMSCTKTKVVHAWWVQSRRCFESASSLGARWLPKWHLHNLVCFCRATMAHQSPGKCVRQDDRGCITNCALYAKAQALHFRR